MFLVHILHELSRGDVKWKCEWCGIHISFQLPSLSPVLTLFGVRFITRIREKQVRGWDRQMWLTNILLSLHSLRLRRDCPKDLLTRVYRWAKIVTSLVGNYIANTTVAIHLYNIGSCKKTYHNNITFVNIPELIFSKQYINLILNHNFLLILYMYNSNWY